MRKACRGQLLLAALDNVVGHSAVLNLITLRGGIVLVWDVLRGIVPACYYRCVRDDIGRRRKVARCIAERSWITLHVAAVGCQCDIVLTHNRSVAKVLAQYFDIGARPGVDGRRTSTL